MIERVAGKIILASGWRRALIAFAAGAFATLALPPYDFFAVCFVSFPVLVWLIDGAVGAVEGGRLRRALPAAIVGWWFGFGYFVAGLWWIGAALLVDAEQFAWALPLAVLGLPAFLAFFYAFACFIAKLVWSDGLSRVFALAFGFGLAEWLRTFLFTGFPWNAIGYAAMPTPLLMQSVGVVGLDGMSALAVLVFAMPAMLSGGRLARTGLVLAVLLIAAHVGFGTWQLQNAGPISGPVGEEQSSKTLNIRIVQASIVQELKWNNEARRSIFDKHIDLTKQPPADSKPKPDVIIWPETSVPYILTRTPEALARIGEALQPGQMLLAGAIREERAASASESLYYNSIITINDEGVIVDAVDKVHLVPFGEYLPFENMLRGLGLQEVVELPGGFQAGSGRHSIKAKGEWSFLPLICYEAIFPGELDYAGQRASAIVNITNDAWYGDTPGPYQHFRQAQVRTVEQGLPLVRAANNGLSAVVDSYGRITASLALDMVGVVDAPLPKIRAPFWGRSPGEREAWSVLLTLLITSLVLQLLQRRRFD